MANATTAQVAKKAAADDKKETGPASIPVTQPAAGTRPRLSPEVRAARQAENLETRIKNLEYRTQLVCNQLKDMGVSSLAGRIANYDDVPAPIIEAAIAEVEKRVAACKAALAARSAQKPAAQKLNLRAAMGTPGSSL